MADLNPRPQRPIHYARPLRLAEGFVLSDLETLAWRFCSEGALVENLNGFGRRSPINKLVRRIQQLIIEQYGWPIRS